MRVSKSKHLGLKNNSRGFDSFELLTVETFLDSLFPRRIQETVMNKITRVASLLILQILVLSCSGQANQVQKDALAAPAWIDTGAIESFPSDLFITGVGSADVTYGDTAAAQAEADSKSIAQVAKQIEVVIQQLSSSFEREVSSGTGETVNQTNIWEKTAAYVKIRVEGVRIESRYHDKKQNRMFSLAVLDRMAQGRKISDEITALKSSALAMTMEAERSRKLLEKVHRAVAAYGLAIKKLILAVRKNQYLGIIAPRMIHRDIPTTLARLQADVSDFMSQFSFEILGGDNQKGLVGGNLPQPLQLKLLYGHQPVPSVPVMFAFVQGSGNVDPYARSDQDGLVSSSVGNLGPTGEKINKIGVYINVYPSDPDIQRELSAIIAPVYAQFTYELPPIQEIRVAVLINEYNLGYQLRESFLKNQVVQSLGQSKLQVIKDIPKEYQLESYDMTGGPALAPKLKKLSRIADLAVIGEARATLLDTSAEASLIIAKGRAVIRIFDLSSNTELGNVDVSTKSAGPDRDEAGRRTLKKLSASAGKAVDKEIQRTLFGK